MASDSPKGDYTEKQVVVNESVTEENKVNQEKCNKKKLKKWSQSQIRMLRQMTTQEKVRQRRNISVN
ncbi:hypothetical protein GCM10020331_092340 [Ectobacillus funiculus]